MTTAEKALQTFSQARDLALSLPFTNTRSMAKQGTPFTILRVLPNRWTEADLANNKPEREQVAYLIELEADYLQENESSGETHIVAKDTQMCLALDRNRTRDKDQELITQIVEENGAVPHCAINQYPSRDPMKSPSHGIVHVSDWRLLKDAVSKNGRTRA